MTEAEAKITINTERLRKARERLGWSQRELARQSGINEVQIGRYEKAQADPSATYLAIIAEKLEVSMDYLAGLTDDPRGHLGDGQLTDDEQELVEAFRRGGYGAVMRLLADRFEKS